MDEESKVTPKAPETATALPAENRHLVPINHGRNMQTVPSAGTGVRRRWPKVALALAVVLGGAGAYWWLHLPPQLPPGIAFGNGRIEAEEIDIDTKFAGRIAEILADAGDNVCVNLNFFFAITTRT